MDIALDPDTGDLLIEGGDLALLDGVEAISQHVAIRLQFFQGEWFLDTRVGIPYYQRVLVKNPDLNAVRFLLRAAVASTPGIGELQSFSTEYANASRTLSVEFEASTEDGPLTFDRELIIG
jgi:hypothetical protein